MNPISKGIKPMVLKRQQQVLMTAAPFIFLMGGTAQPLQSINLLLIAI